MRAKLQYLSVVVLVAVAVVLMYQRIGETRRDAASQANSLQEAVAYKMGQLVAEIAGSPGPIVFIQVPALDDLGVKMNARIRGAFDRGLADRAEDVKEIDLEAGLPREAYEALARKMYHGDWGDQLVEWTKAHPAAVAVVNLNPLPDGMDPAILAGLPPLFSVLPMLPEPEAHARVTTLNLGAGLLPRETLSQPGAVPREGSPEAMFNAAYKILVP